jgi:hypothetical protein
MSARPFCSRHDVVEIGLDHPALGDILQPFLDVPAQRFECVTIRFSFI